MTKIAQVAAAIEEAILIQNGPTLDVRALAIAAIKTMKFLTLPMILAGSKASTNHEVWTSMIEAALSE